MPEVDWSRIPTNLAICDCGGEYLSRVDIPSFQNFVSEKPCPRCGRNDRVHEVVFNEPLPRLWHFLSKVFGFSKYRD